MEAIRPKFNEKKTTEIISRLIQLNGGEINFTRAIKLMYYIDRAALSRWGVSLTDDDYYALDKGPVLSRTYDLIKGKDISTFWNLYIEKNTNVTIKLKQFCKTERISKAEEKLISDIFEEHRHKSVWELIQETHKLPEWENPNGSSSPIPYRKVLEKLGKSSEEIEEIEAEWETLAIMSELSSDFN
jgi:uncharacterized phage-associated protein